MLSRLYRSQFFSDSLTGALHALVLCAIFVLPAIAAH
jgi:hypothetical protein